MKFLPHKTRQTILEIDLNALANNFKYFTQLVDSSTHFIIVIKAFAYGAGIKNIAKQFSGKSIDYLAVACVDEGVELKDAGIEQRIMILNPEPAGYQKLIEYGLEPVIYDFHSLHEFLEALRIFRSYYKPYPIHLKLDTGMHRLGFMPDELSKLSSILLGEEALKVKTVFSHLVASGNPDFDDFTNEQINSFEEMTSVLEVVLGYSFQKHILNSGGIERFPRAHFDLVRLGIGLYGISAQSHQLQNVYTWKTRVAQIKHVKKGDSVSYNRSWVATKDSKIAAIFVGYADGLSRKLGNGNWQLKWKGRSFPIVGDICMDLCMVDVTNSNIEVGDELVIFDSQLEIQTMADKLDTIHYEVLTNISKRVKRVYKT